MSKDSRKLYHSFLRKRSRAQNDYGPSLKTMELIAKYGLLASPELILYSVPLPGGSTTELAFIQIRACLTCLTEDEVPRHNEIFGPISIEFTVETALALGAAPVWYIPRESNDVDFSKHGPYMMSILVSAIHFLKHTGLKGFFGGQNVAGKEYRTTATEMYDALNNLVALIVPIDTERHSIPELGYYTQMEWRILKGLEVGPHKNSLELTPGQAAEIASCNESFWNTEIVARDQRFKRIDRTRILQGTNKTHVLKVAEKILCPNDIVEDVLRIVVTYGFETPVVGYRA